MLHPPPSFHLPSSCASDRLCVGVHERKKEREWWREKALIYVKADMRGGAQLKHSLTKALLTLYSDSNTNQNQLYVLHDSKNNAKPSFNLLIYYHFAVCQQQLQFPFLNKSPASVHLRFPSLTHTKIEQTLAHYAFHRYFQSTRSTSALHLIIKLHSHH